MKLRLNVDHARGTIDAEPDDVASLRRFAWALLDLASAVEDDSLHRLIMFPTRGQGVSVSVIDIDRIDFTWEQ